MGVLRPQDSGLPPSRQRVPAPSRQGTGRGDPRRLAELARGTTPGTPVRGASPRTPPCSGKPWRRLRRVTRQRHYPALTVEGDERQSLMARLFRPPPGQPDADGLARPGTRHRQPKLLRDATVAVVVAEYHDAFRPQPAARPAVAANALHVVLLLRDRRDDRPADDPALSQPEQHVHPPGAVLGAGEDGLHVARRYPQQGVLRQRLVLVQPRHRRLAVRGQPALAIPVAGRA